VPWSTDLPHNSSKQVSMLAASGLGVERIYTVRGSSHFFRGGSSEPGGARLDLAVMGDGAVIHRSGELATLIFRVRCEGNGNVRFEDAALRDRTNKTLNTAVSEMDGEIANHGAARTRLSGAWPSPFNPTTTVKFELRKAGHVVVDVYDVNGRQIRTLVDEHRPAGEYDAFWDGRDNRGRSISSGVYFVRMRSGKHRFTSKVILLK